MWLFTAASAAPAVDVAFSPRWSTRREELYSPLAYDAAGLGGRVGLAIPADRWDVTAGLDAALGRGRSGPAFSFVADGETLETPSSSFVDVRLHEVTSYRLSDRVAVGLGPSADVSTAVYNFGRGGVFTYYGAIGLDAAARVDVPVPGASRLQVSVGAPLAAFVSRSPYALNDDRYIDTVGGGGLGLVFGLLGRGSVQSWDRRIAGRASAVWTLERDGVQPVASLDAAAERHVADNGEELVRTSLGITVGARFGGGAR